MSYRSKQFFHKILGNTPLVEYGELGRAKLYFKLEGYNPTGSLKDRSAFQIISDLEATGRLTPDKTLLDASSGSFACSLAYLGKILGYRVRVVVNSKISKTNLAFLKICDAEVTPFGAVTGDGYKYCLELVEKEPNRYAFADQLNNPSSPKAHYLTTGPEILKGLPSVSAIIGSMGSGATLLGISRFLREIGSSVSVFGSVAEPKDDKKVAGTYLFGVDYPSPFIKELQDEHMLSAEIPIFQKDAMANVLQLASEGVLIGPQGGGVFQAAKKAIDQYDLEGPVVLVIGDSLLKNIDRF